MTLEEAKTLVDKWIAGHSHASDAHTTGETSVMVTTVRTERLARLIERHRPASVAILSESMPPV